MSGTTGALGPGPPGTTRAGAWLSPSTPAAACEAPSAPTHVVHAPAFPVLSPASAPAPPSASPFFNTEEETVHSDRGRDLQTTDPPSSDSALLIQKGQSGRSASCHAARAFCGSASDTYKAWDSPRLQPRLLKETLARHSGSRASSPYLLQFSRVRLFATPWTVTSQASLSITNSRSLLRLLSITSVMPSNHLLKKSRIMSRLLCTSLQSAKHQLGIVNILAHFNDQDFLRVSPASISSSPALQVITSPTPS